MAVLFVDGPLAPERLAALWRRSELPTEALPTAFAPIDRRAAEAAGLAPVDLLLHLFLTTYLAEDILPKTDRASMFNGLEVRAPFLDRRFAEYALSLPRGLKLRGRTGKFILKRLACHHLPRTIVERKKHGFALPIGALIRTLFRERCRDVLLSCANPVADWFERNAIEVLFDEHDRGRHDHGKKLWALYTLFCVAGGRQAPVGVDRFPAASVAY
jgi:asparagine synthase (glutamine-hydrolysing)